MGLTLSLGECEKGMRGCLMILEEELTEKKDVDVYEFAM